MKSLEVFYMIEKGVDCLRL